MFNWLSSLFNRKQNAGLRPVNSVPHVQAVAGHNAHLWSGMDDTRTQMDVYQWSSWVYMAVNRIAESCALVPMEVYRMDGERKLAVERHPVEALLDNPNPYMSRFELLEQTIGMLELTGNAYWYLAGDARGVPSQIWALRPDRVRIVPDPQAYVRGYVYEIDGQMIPFDAIEIIHFKRWHPTNDYYGMSALESASLSITSDRAMAEWNRNTFGKNNAIPAGVLSIKDMVSDADYERLKREWRTSYGGVERKTAFLRGGQVEWHNIGLSHTDLDFLAGRKAHREEILNVFGVPMGLFSENATEANAKVAERMFVEKTLYPKLVRLSQKITQELLPFYAGTLIAEFDDIRPTDAKARLDDIKTALPIMSINEIRTQYYHLPEVTWGDLPVGVIDSDVVENLVDELPANDNEDETPESTADAIKSELAQWERFALKRVGQAGGRAFNVHYIPDDLAIEISAGLLGVESVDDAKAVFISAREQLDVA